MPTYGPQAQATSARNLSYPSMQVAPGNVVSYFVNTCVVGFGVAGIS